MIHKALYFSLIFLLITGTMKAQDFSVLIEKSWQNNDQLKARYFELQQAEAALREARSMYGPMVSFGAQYTLAA